MRVVVVHAQILSKLGKVDEAAAEIKTVIRLEEAHELIQKAIGINPDNAAYLDSMARLYYREGKYADAEPLLLKALQKFADPTMHDHLGDVYVKLGKTKEAVAEWQASLSEFRNQATRGGG